MEKYDNLKGRVAVVTGAASGIGEAIAKIYGQVGMKVVLADYNDANADEIVSWINDNGGEAVFVKCDVADEEQVKNVIDTAVNKFGKLHYLVNSAGVGCGSGPVHELEISSFDRVMDINVKGTFMMMKYGIEAMLKTKSDKCSVINISSSTGMVASAGLSIYTSSKYAVVGLTKTAALEYAAKDITVNAICPGVVMTGLYKNTPKEMLAIYEKSCPNGRMAQPEEIAELALFLSSDAGRYMNGSIIAIDAGQTAGINMPVRWKNPEI